jgi:hypothetical protein
MRTSCDRADSLEARCAAHRIDLGVRSFQLVRRVAMCKLLVMSRTFARRPPIFLLSGLAVIALLGCKSMSEPCQQRIADCLKRCDSTGADPNPIPGSPPERSMSQCESQCGGCRNDPQPKPSGPPTWTGGS